MPVGHLDIRSLRAFVSVVDTGSVTEAARRLCRTQPAITLQIRRLEEQIDKPVFEIGARRPVLTADGEVMLGMRVRFCEFMTSYGSSCGLAISPTVSCSACRTFMPPICCRRS